MRPGFSWLDFKLGFRMLVKYPGLTLVGGLAIAFAIWVGAIGAEFTMSLFDPTLPLPGGDRVVGIQNRHLEFTVTRDPTAHDFATWRDELELVEDVGAFRTVERNLITGNGRGEPSEVAAISPSGFRVARVPPLLGRTLVEGDQRAGAPPVVVIGHHVWQTRFAGDSAVVGREVRLGRTVHTVVGVMPEGFAFPVSHGLWVPLRLNVLDHEPGRGPALKVFGRLAPGASLEEAQAELAAVGGRTTAAFPETHEHLRPEVMPYGLSILKLPSTSERLAFVAVNLFFMMLLVLMCGNVALLMFARAASRENELLVRNALGASRGRIIAQLFGEALVLAGTASAIGLVAASFGLSSWLDTMAPMVGRLPFWIDADLSPAILLYAGLLTLLGAAIAGIIPGLKVTRDLGTRLRQATAGGGGFRFGGVWTAVIVTQVAVTVAFPVTTFFVRRDAEQVRSVDAGFPAEEYLSARLEMDSESAAGASADSSRTEFLARYGAAVRELERRLEADPAVAEVTFGAHLPRMDHPTHRIEVDEGGAEPPDPSRPATGYRVSSTSVAPDYFDVLDAPILSGRGFHSGDLGSDPPVVIVNRSFVEDVLGGRNPLGRRVRYLRSGGDDPSAEEEPGRWHEIVGVVRDMGMGVEPDPGVAGFYHPVAVGAAFPVHLAVHVRAEPESFAPGLRQLAAAVDPTLRLHELMPLDEVDRPYLRVLGFWFRLTVFVSSVALLLSLAGIYSVMAFTVTQRTREIGIRVALGADARRVAFAIFRRPLAQVGLGVAGGGVLVLALTMLTLRALSPGQVGLIIAYAVLMMGVCTLACVVPTRRALAIEPTEALKADG